MPQKTKEITCPYCGETKTVLWSAVTCGQTKCRVGMWRKREKAKKEAARKEVEMESAKNAVRNSPFDMLKRNHRIKD